MSSSYCDRHHCDSTKGCRDCEDEDPEVARTRLSAARALVMQTHKLAPGDAIMLAVRAIDLLRDELDRGLANNGKR